MKTYDFLLFDADGTLLDFDRSESLAIQETAAHFCPEKTNAAEERYHRINAALWERFNKGEITRSELLLSRFSQLCEALALQADPAEMNRYYMRCLATHADLLPGAEEVLRDLSSRYKMYIITNGASYTQRGRFEKSPITPLFKQLFISEEMGVQKPQKEFFSAVAAAIPGFSNDRALVIGDSLSSDILGANNAGIDCCWYNPQNAPIAENLHCDYQIQNLHELLQILR